MTKLIKVIQYIEKTKILDAKELSKVNGCSRAITNFAIQSYKYMESKK